MEITPSGEYGKWRVQKKKGTSMGEAEGRKRAEAEKGGKVAHSIKQSD